MWVSLTCLFLHAGSEDFHNKTLVVGVVAASGSPPLLAVDGEGQRDVERVVVLHQRRVLVVEHQLLQGAVQVVGLREAEAGGRLVDDAMLHLAVHPEGDRHVTRDMRDKT